YYDKLGESPLFAAAIILHPRFGISWLEATWVSEEQLAWVRDAKAGIKDCFTRWYDANQGLCEKQRSTTHRQGRWVKRMISTLSGLIAKQRKRLRRVAVS
ncbi:hypothetical protein NW769_015470, partial [Fusarium oxysporum]